eukprot:COSAG05_NODE_1981_length_3754_cov_8.506156_6_plen_48_part_01
MHLSREFTGVAIRSGEETKKRERERERERERVDHARLSEARAGGQSEC